jgi:hypothetical protein
MERNKLFLIQQFRTLIAVITEINGIEVSFMNRDKRINKIENKMSIG